MTEINRYRVALIKYRISNRFPFLKRLFHTQFGFCYHFDIIDFGISWMDWLERPYPKNDFKENLPQLYKLKPRCGLYWFEKEDTYSRILLLQTAILMCKNKKS